MAMGTHWDSSGTLQLALPTALTRAQVALANSAIIVASIRKIHGTIVLIDFNARKAKSSQSPID